MANHSDDFPDGFSDSPDDTQVSDPLTGDFENLTDLEESTDPEDVDATLNSAPAWEQLADFVEHTATQIVDELLFEDPEDDTIHSLDFDSSAIEELHTALTEEPPPPSPAMDAIPKYDTQEVEIIGWEDSAPTNLIFRAKEDEPDFFGTTGIELVDFETGGQVKNADIPKIDTGSWVLEELEAAGKAARPDRALGIKLVGGAEPMLLPGFWGRYLAEMKAEIIAEDDLRHRAAYVYVFSNVVRGLTGTRPEFATQLGELADESGAALRSTLLERIARTWGDADETFFELVGRLERLDTATEDSVATIRRSSIAMERLIDGEIPESTRQRLRDMMIPPETFPSLVAKAVEGHASGNLADAIHAWRRLGKHARTQLREASATLVGYFLQGHAEFFEVVSAVLKEGSKIRPLLLTLERESVARASRFEEARALKTLIAQDVKAGRSLGTLSEQDRQRVQRETAARLARLSRLLEGLDAVDFTDTVLEGFDSYKVLKDAASLDADNLLILRHLERAAHARDDFDVLEPTLVTQATVCSDPVVKALTWEKLAALHDLSDGSLHKVAECLSAALQADPTCLPALISLGQQLILHGDFEHMLDLKAVPPGEEVRSLNAAWRRAELLERTGGDPREILSLYRSGRDEKPQSVHLMFCVERALARVGEWRGLRTLYDAISEDENRLGDRLRESTLPVDDYQLAVEALLEDAPGDLYPQWNAYLDRRFGDKEPGQDYDETALWRVVDRDVAERDVVKSLRKVEAIEFATREQTGVRRRRLRIWHAFLSENHAEDRTAAADAYRELYDEAQGVFLRRYAVQGLLRTQQFGFLAEKLMHDEQPLWGWGVPEVNSDIADYAARMAAELLALDGQYDEALDILNDVMLRGETIQDKAEVAERALHHAIRSQKWERAFRFLPICFDGEDPRTLAEFSRHLGASLDDAQKTLSRLDEAGGFTSSGPIVILDELELSYRARDWKRAATLLSQGLATAEAGSIGFRAFLLEQAVLLGSWGHESPEQTLACLDDLWSLEGATPGMSPFFAVASFIRTYSRLGRKEDLDTWVEHAKANFTPAVAADLAEEQNVPRKAKDAAKWYAKRVDEVAEPLRPYYRWMQATLEWMFGNRNGKTAQAVATATSEGDPTHRVGGFLTAIALHGNDPDGCARQLRLLRRAGNSRPVQDWALIRGLFHMSASEGAPDKAIALILEDEKYQSFSWSPIAVELLGRSLRRTVAIDRLRDRIRYAQGKRSLALELAQILGDVGMFPRLAQEGDPAALVRTELLAAQGERPHVPGWNIQLRHEDLLRSINEEGQEQVRRRLMAYFQEIDEAFWGSPWCPIRLTRGDLTRFGLSVSELEALKDAVAGFDHTGVGSEARLLVARQFQRTGRRDVAAELRPRKPTDDIVSTAWSLLNHAIDPFSRDEDGIRWALALWRRRLEECGSGIAPEIRYEIGKYLELLGDEDQAVSQYEDALEARPAFLPAQVAAGRLLIRQAQWERLVQVTEHQIQSAATDELESSLAFRLAYIYDRRLRDMPEASEKAEEYLRRALMKRPGHLPSLEMALDIAYRARRYEAASEYLKQMVEVTRSPQLSVVYRIELADIHHQYLNDREGALGYYHEALKLEPANVAAFLGVIRTDLTGEIALEAIEFRLRSVISAREAADLGNRVFALCRVNDRARDVMKARFNDHYAFHLSRLAELVKELRIDPESISILERAYPDTECRLVVRIFERVGQPRPLVGQDLIDASKVGTDPFSEGRLIRAMHHAWKERDLEAVGLLATARARRSDSPVVRSAELTWMVATQYMRGDHEAALHVCERLLTQYMDFLPAVKMAKLLAEDLGEWQSVVRWCKRDAHLTRVESIAHSDRLYASEIQRNRLGDLDAAVEQLRRVLSESPMHEDAFDRLRELLKMRREFPELLKAYENRLIHVTDDEDKVTLLNQMADISLQQLDDGKSTIAYLTRSLETNPKQRRRLRQIGELYEAARQFERAIACYRSAIKLTEDRQLLHHLWSHVGWLLESELMNYGDAKAAYLEALKLQPEDGNALTALARVCEMRMELQESIQFLNKVLQVSSDSNTLRNARVSIVRVQGKAGSDLGVILQSSRRLLLHHPEYLDAVDDVRSRLIRAGRETDISEYFRGIAFEALQQSPRQGLAAHYEISKRLGLMDRAFQMASLAYHEGSSDESMAQFYHSQASPRRWPRRAIPNEMTAGLMPEALVAPFVELLRLSRDGIEEAMGGAEASKYIKRSNRIKENRNAGVELAMRWPALYGLELRDAYMVNKPLEDGSEVVLDGGVRLVLDKRWETTSEPTELLVALGRKLAALSMGVGPWMQMKRSEQVGVFAVVVSRFVSGWTLANLDLPKEFSVPRLTKWVQRKGDRVAPYALEISGRFGLVAIEEQFTNLNVACERLALIVLDDSGKALRASNLDPSQRTLGSPEFLFLFGRAAEAIRNHVGVAISEY